MPQVAGKKYPYTEKGKKDAKKAMKKKGMNPMTMALMMKGKK